MRHPIAVAGIIERYDDHVLIVLPGGGAQEPRLWQFPCGLARAEESAEAAMRRVAKDQLGLEVEIVVGQPAFVGQFDGRDVDWRYFFCDIVVGEPRIAPSGEVRWVSKGHLREYEFDPACRPVVDWLMAP